MEMDRVALCVTTHYENPAKVQLTSLFARDVHVNRVYVVSPGPDFLLYLDA
jgi:hypothetical protein